MCSLLLELSKQRSLLKMMEDRGYTLCQHNGQRTYGGPPPHWGNRPTPSRECEVFIGRLPRVCFEDELIPLFAGIGELYEFRLMLDFSGTNRGYAYAHYTTIEDAQKAIDKLNKYEIRPGHPIGVLKSKNNCRLLFGNIESAMNAQKFREFIFANTDEVLQVFVFEKFEELKHTDFRISSEIEEAFLARMPGNNENRLFAIVEYETHKAAAVARRVLIPKYGQNLAIDWAVPPRERKLDFKNNTASSTAITPRDGNLPLVPCSHSKIRPVPELSVSPSPLDNVNFMPKTFKAVVKFFKYQLSVCLYKSVDRAEIPLFICKEIERKIVERITNVENCGEAVQLIFNYFSWFNEKKKNVINSEVKSLLQEVKYYSDSFAFFIYKKLSYLSDENADNYFIHTLPLHLNVLFRIILLYDPEYEMKISSSISKGLTWLQESMKHGDKSTKDLIREIITLVQNEDETSLDKASKLAKSLFFSNVTSRQPENLPFERQNCNQSQAVPFKFNFQMLKESNCHHIPMPFSQIWQRSGETSPNAYAYPPVPLLLVQPSIMIRVPFMPPMFDSVLSYFKHLIRGYVSIVIRELNLPTQISDEIERKIIDRMAHLQNCSEGLQLILNYFNSFWKNNMGLIPMDTDTEKLLEEIKMYADSFIDFVWKKTWRVCVLNEETENYFCIILPFRLNILFHIMLIFNREHPRKLLIGITDGLIWLEKLSKKSDITITKFLEELRKFILESDNVAYERALNLGEEFFAKTMNLNGVVNNGSPFLNLKNVCDKTIFDPLPCAESPKSVSDASGESSSV